VARPSKVFLLSPGFNPLDTSMKVEEVRLLTEEKSRLVHWSATHRAAFSGDDPHGVAALQAGRAAPAGNLAMVSYGLNNVH
jgi:hypothetical protein